MPITANGVQITMWTVVFAIASLGVLCFFYWLSRGSSLLGPVRGIGVNWLTMAVGTLAATILLFLGLNIDNPDVVYPYQLLTTILQAIKTTGSGGTPTQLNAEALTEILRGTLPEPELWSECICAYIYAYNCFLCIFAPVSIVNALASRFVHFLSPVRVWLRARARETYVFDELSGPTLALANSIKERMHGAANLVFAEETGSIDDDLHVRAISLGATCIQNPIDTVWRQLANCKRVHLMLSSKDEERNVTRASSIRRACVDAHDSKRRDSMPNVSIYAVSSLRGAESLFDRDGLATNEGSEQAALTIPVRVIDWTRNTIEKALREYPLYLLGWQPAGAKVGASGIECGQIVDNAKRHVVVVGAGHVGMEFLRLALSVSRGRMPAGCAREAIGYRFDVFDNRADALHKSGNGASECLAKHRFEVQTSKSYSLGALDCEFHLCDAQGAAFLETLGELDEAHGGITYVFVSLGDDFATAQVSLRIRELFESWRKVGGELRMQPVIVAVLDDEELCDALAHARRDSFDYRIDTLGSPKDMYTYDLVFGATPGSGVAAKEEPERTRRRSRTKSLYLPYRFLAYLRSTNQCAELVARHCVRQGGGVTQPAAAMIWKAYSEFRGQLKDGGLSSVCGEQEAVYRWAEGEDLME